MARSRSIGNIYAELSVKDKMAHGINSATKKLAAFSASAAKGIAIGGLAGAGASLAIFSKNAIGAASNMEETLSKSSVIFGSNAKDMEVWARTAAKSFGQSNQMALESAATIGNMFIAMGMGSGEVSKMSKSMVELASDLASFNNTTPEDAIMAIGAALRGENEPIRRYGVLLDDATLKAKAFAMGLYGGKGNLTPQAKALVAYEVILSQTKTAQGDFAKTADGLANSQRTLTALFADATVAAGQGLLPVMLQMVSAMKDMDMLSAGQTFASMTTDALELAGALTKVAGLTYNIMGGWAVNGVAGYLGSKNPTQGQALPTADFTIDGIGSATMNNAGMQDVMTPKGGEKTSGAPLFLTKEFAANARKAGDAIASINKEINTATVEATGNEDAIRNLASQYERMENISNLTDLGIPQSTAEDLAGKLESLRNNQHGKADSLYQDAEVRKTEVNDYQRRGLSLDSNGGGGIKTDVAKQTTMMQEMRDALLRMANSNLKATW